jgi:hypothetical protein
MPFTGAIVSLWKCDGFGCMLLMAIPIWLSWISPLLLSVWGTHFYVKSSFRGLSKWRRFSVMVFFGIFFPSGIQYANKLHFRSTNLNALVHSVTSHPMVTTF